jgi:anti-anti-sigma factor
MLLIRSPHDVALFRLLSSGARLMPGLDRRVTIEVEARHGTTTIVVNGELDLATMPLLAAKLAMAAWDRPRRLVFDLSGTRFMDCGSARMITTARQWLPDDGRPVIRRPRPGVRRVLELTGLDAHCEIEPLAMGSSRARHCAQEREPSGADR